MQKKDWLGLIIIQILMNIINLLKTLFNYFQLFFLNLKNDETL